MTTETNDLDSVMRRVQKLLAIAEDSRADANEAAAAARMAENIMRKFQIEHADVLMKKFQADAVDMFDTGFVSGALKADGPSASVKLWASWLATSIAKLNDCQARYGWTKEKGKCLKFSGYAADVKISVYMFEFIVSAMLAATDRFSKQIEANRTQSNSFRQGFISACISSINKIISEKKQAMLETSSSRALVIVKGQAVAKHFGEIKYKTGREIRTGDAYHIGRKEGSKLDVNRKGLGTSAKTNYLT